MRRGACADVCPAPPAPLHPANRTSENKELLRQQLLSSSKARADKGEAPKPKHRSRQKNRWKLKFHHQALPQEYLDHYEQSLQKTKPKKPEKPKDTIDLNNITNETFNIWAQRLAGIQNDGTLTVPQIQNMAKVQKKEDKKKSPAIAPSKIVTYDDLPYMGEMTLNNSKPRRGRKPKKADICHLIYENYGTVVPGQPPPQVDRSQLSLCPPFRNDALSTPKTDLQNKIISSLLEKKLSQENKKRLESLSPPQFASPDDPMPAAPVTIAGPLHSDDEPLNLCIRDLHELKIQIQKKFGNIYSSLPEVKTEPETEIIEDKEQPNAISVIQRNTNLSATASSSPDLSRQTRNVSPTLSEPAQSTASPDGDGKIPGYVYWPNAGIYMHPLALQTQLLYYQRLAAAGQLPYSPEQERLSTPNSTSESTSAEHSPSADNKSKLVLKQISELLDPNVIKQTEETKSPDLTKMKRTSPNPAPVQPVKRKRSAIYIPPVPTKTNSTTPTTEVSICKFKFTGGSKPSLQEKKMLSVDSGGNFRYYSGTGNKGNKGYEYLHRDSNQGRAQLAEAAASSKPADAPPAALSKEDLSKKKRKSRKSLQREKLEQTFKEKGFLIQTQQLQSAEGATYCKFRQLRKFTRYLFRSWKDYLPGELDERTGEAPNPQPPPSEGPASEWG
ncbi:hypothetical protein MSG28_012036 [Choristoneura fumiferana]|uniref:Uncharacterized protein n=2 Tax=Choristoneura fumiferana TaxID=7141 RepID=A0ACC0KMZ3_CHOFU|nr:hypothetical protein MSG28_012036 [Choristoneura fumiferana]